MPCAPHYTDPIVLEHFSSHFDFKLIVFNTRYEAGVLVYCTNVLMCIGMDYTMIGLDMIADENQRADSHLF